MAKETKLFKKQLAIAKEYHGPAYHDYKDVKKVKGTTYALSFIRAKYPKQFWKPRKKK